MANPAIPAPSTSTWDNKMQVITGGLDKMMTGRFSCEAALQEFSFIRYAISRCHSGAPDVRVIA